MWHLKIASAVLAFCALQSWSQTDSRTVQGVVHDPAGYVVSGASVLLRGPGYNHAATSAGDGAFRISGAPREQLTLIVDSRGFAPFTTSVAADSNEINVVLRPASVSQEINVTANRVGTTMSDTAESVEVFSRADLKSVAAESVDQALREIPGFTLFRRSDSRIANPTTQGASLRGVGGSGASRTPKPAIIPARAAR